VPDDGAAARELARVLKPGGCALISVRMPGAPVPRTDEVERADGYRIMRAYSLAQLRELLAPAGLEIVWWRSCFHLPMRSLIAIWRSRYIRLGSSGRSVMPRLAVLAFGYADRWLPLGRSWDLTVLARRCAPPLSGPGARSETEHASASEP
jgi:SAM-dependent methyltransferase